MNWKLVLDTDLLKKSLPDPSIVHLNEWICKNTNYPFFTYNKKVWMVDPTSSEPSHTDYIVRNGVITTEDGALDKITRAISNGRLKLIEGKRKWKQYDVNVERTNDTLGYRVIVSYDGKIIGSVVSSAKSIITPKKKTLK